MPKEPHAVGDTYGDILSWNWDRSRRRFEATHGDHWIYIQFYKVGGRYSRTFETELS